VSIGVAKNGGNFVIRTTLLVLLAVEMFLSGCATVVNGTTQRVSFASDPPGAAVMVDGIPIGDTPTSIDLKRDSTHLVTVEKNGYVASDRIIEQKTSWWFAGNLLLGGIIGGIVDYSTGAMYNLSPQDVSPVLLAATKPEVPTTVVVSPVQNASLSTAVPAPPPSEAPSASNGKPVAQPPVPNGI
jgi:hypothetical protein